MSNQQNNNSGALFLNDRKNKDSHPDFTGSCVIGGVEYWISGWEKQTRNREVMFSLAFNPKDQTGGRQQSSQSGQKRYAPQANNQREEQREFQQEPSTNDDQDESFIPF